MYRPLSPQRLTSRPFIDEYGQGVLIYAAQGNSDPRVIHYLVELGLDINQRTHAGWTALMYAARYNENPEILGMFLSLGALALVTNMDGQRAVDLARLNPNPQFTSSAAFRQLTAASAPRPAVQPAPARTCCRVCRSGKACGDSCIAATSNCTRGAGCACNGSVWWETPVQVATHENQWFLPSPLDVVANLLSVPCEIVELSGPRVGAHPSGLGRCPGSPGDNAARSAGITRSRPRRWLTWVGRRSRFRRTDGRSTTILMVLRRLW